MHGKTRTGEEFSRFWIPVVCRKDGVEQSFKSLKNRCLQNVNSWNQLAAAVPRQTRAPKAVFTVFGKFWGCFWFLFTSYSQGRFPSLAVRRESSKRRKWEQEKMCKTSNFYLRKGLDAKWKNQVSRRNSSSAALNASQSSFCRGVIV